jgi:NADH:ubiquinone oxidoreductase subunit D
MMIVIAAVAVGIVAFILYALERRSKGEAILWEHAGKLSLLSGLITSGVVFATTAEAVSTVSDVATSVAEKASDIQDMFVGTPSF